MDVERLRIEELKSKLCFKFDEDDLSPRKYKSPKRLQDGLMTSTNTTTTTASTIESQASQSFKTHTLPFDSTERGNVLNTIKKQLEKTGGMLPPKYYTESTGAQGKLTNKENFREGEIDVSQLLFPVHIIPHHEIERELTSAGGKKKSTGKGVLNMSPPKPLSMYSSPRKEDAPWIDLSVVNSIPMPVSPPMRSGDPTLHALMQQRENAELDGEISRISPTENTLLVTLPGGMSRLGLSRSGSRSGSGTGASRQSNTSRGGGIARVVRQPTGATSGANTVRYPMTPFILESQEAEPLPYSKSDSFQDLASMDVDAISHMLEGNAVDISDSLIPTRQTSVQLDSARGSRGSRKQKMGVVAETEHRDEEGNIIVTSKEEDDNTDLDNGSGTPWNDTLQEDSIQDFNLSAADGNSSPGTGGGRLSPTTLNMADALDENSFSKDEICIPDDASQATAGSIASLGPARVGTPSDGNQVDVMIDSPVTKPLNPLSAGPSLHMSSLDISLETHYTSNDDTKNPPPQKPKIMRLGISQEVVDNFQYFIPDIEGFDARLYSSQISVGGADSSAVQEDGSDLNKINGQMVSYKERMPYSDEHLIGSFMPQQPGADDAAKEDDGLTDKMGAADGGTLEDSTDSLPPSSLLKRVESQVFNDSYVSRETSFQQADEKPAVIQEDKPAVIQEDKPTLGPISTTLHRSVSIVEISPFKDDKQDEILAMNSPISRAPPLNALNKQSTKRQEDIGFKDASLDLSNTGASSSTESQDNRLAHLAASERKSTKGIIDMRDVPFALNGVGSSSSADVSPRSVHEDAQMRVNRQSFASDHVSQLDQHFGRPPWSPERVHARSSFAESSIGGSFDSVGRSSFDSAACEESMHDVKPYHSRTTYALLPDKLKPHEQFKIMQMIGQQIQGGNSDRRSRKSQSRRKRSRQSSGGAVGMVSEITNGISSLKGFDLSYLESSLKHDIDMQQSEAAYLTFDAMRQAEKTRVLRSREEYQKLHAQQLKSYYEQQTGKSPDAKMTFHDLMVEDSVGHTLMGEGGNSMRIGSSQAYQIPLKMGSRSRPRQLPELLVKSSKGNFSTTSMPRPPSGGQGGQGGPSAVWELSLKATGSPRTARGGKRDAHINNLSASVQSTRPDASPRISSAFNKSIQSFHPTQSSADLPMQSSTIPEHLKSASLLSASLSSLGPATSSVLLPSGPLTMNSFVTISPLPTSSKVIHPGPAKPKPSLASKQAPLDAAEMTTVKFDPADTAADSTNSPDRGSSPLSPSVHKIYQRKKVPEQFPSRVPPHMPNVVPTNLAMLRTKKLRTNFESFTDSLPSTCRSVHSKSASGFDPRKSSMAFRLQLHGRSAEIQTRHTVEQAKAMLAKHKE
jgi:hypothetical protein